MKIYILTLAMLAIGLFPAHGQTDAAFTTVPVVNGKVVFEEFIPAGMGSNANRRYEQLQNWAKKRFTENPLVTGIRFNDKARSVTVSLMEELQVPADKSGVKENMIMNFRFDATITNAGCLLVVRDITYQKERKGKGSFSPEIYTAEQVIADQAVNLNGDESEWRNNLRSETLRILNELYADLSQAF